MLQLFEFLGHTGKSRGSAAYLVVFLVARSKSRKLDGWRFGSEMLLLLGERWVLEDSGGFWRLLLS